MPVLKKHTCREKVYLSQVSVTCTSHTIWGDHAQILLCFPSAHFVVWGFLFGGFWGPDPLQEHFFRSKGARAPPRWPREDFATISDEFGPPFGGNCGAILEPCRHLAGKSGNADYKKGVLRDVQNQDPQKVDFGTSWEGARRVCSLTIAQFPLFRPDPFWLHFGLHYEVILGAWGGTILFGGSKWCHFGGQKWRSTFGITWRTPCRGGVVGGRGGGGGGGGHFQMHIRNCKLFSLVVFRVYGLIFNT